MDSMAFMKQVTGKIENVFFVLGDKFVTGLLYYFHMSTTKPNQIVQIMSVLLGHKASLGCNLTIASIHIV